MGPPVAAVASDAPPAPVPAKRFEHPRAVQAIIAASRQQGNPILACVRSTLVEYADGLVPDYLAGPETAVLFISLRFQRLHPDYLQRRVEALASRHRVRVLLCRVDLEHPEEQLEQVTLLAFHSGLSLLLAFSDAEAAAYLETLHRYQSKSAEALMGKLAEGDHKARLTEVLTTVKGVNRTDAASLAGRFGSLARIASASVEELQRCPGIGDTKVKRLHHVFHAPFFTEPAAH
uniref:DNA excision repair protein ERCC-1 n=1 Tax=Lingulaulax polyedra TaxID=160621 RepID=A0A516AGH3_LINPO|nr:DNA excision repair protein ERCC-1 [Lingulodinium polyedra]